MDVEDDLNNAVAGPSTITQDSNFVFLPPPAVHPPPRTSLASTQDLLGRFNLHSAYDKHVRPSIPPQTPLSHASIPPLTPAALLPDSDDKMKKNSYRFLIKSVPGKHSMKKDDYLTTMMLVPPKQRIPIVEFDERTQREAFTVSAEGLKGWNASTLVVESAQAKEDRRKRSSKNSHVLKLKVLRREPHPAHPVHFLRHKWHHQIQINYPHNRRQQYHKCNSFIQSLMFLLYQYRPLLHQLG
ncbi:hypothetical protein BDR07DRAFT_1020289 [Suillus spraguei]|nr:hypothetical protein BDR07DRAFT_1020289 [Suillus spraguei]